MVAVLPIHYPKPLLTALDVHAVELWGPPGPPVGPAAGRIQAYVCPLARNALAFLAAGRADAVDAVLVPHTCDSLQGLATVLADFGGWPKPVLTFYHPKGGRRRSACEFATAELRVLSGRLEALTGRPLESERLHAALALHRAIDEASAFLLANRAHLDGPDTDLYALLRRGEYLWPAEHLAEIDLLRQSVDRERTRPGIPLLVTGYVPEPAAFLHVLAEAGAYVAADDYAAVGRRVGAYAGLDTSAVADPLAALAELSFAGPPCPTRSTDVEARTAHLAALARRGGARGVIAHTVKFCEPELFDIPALRRTFGAAGLPLLHVECDLEAALSGQTATRLEAFVEMLGAREGGM